MLIASIPVKYQEYWAQNAGGSFVRMPPFAASPTPGAASFDQGFPPTNMTLGGIPPFGQDENGILRIETQWTQWFQAGGPIPYDATFQGQISGYPLGSKVASANVVGRYWTSTTDGNVTNPDASGAGWTGSQDLVVPATGALLQFTSATVLTLAPKNGGLLWINGFNYSVPASLTVTNSGLAASTLYYVYAAISGGNMVLDAPSTTGYALAANGIPQKSGDATRTLVGMISTTGSSQFVSQDGALQVRSYFQRSLQRTRTNFSTNQTTSSSTLAEIDTSIRNSFLAWNGEDISFATSGSTTTSTANAAVTAISFDGGPVEEEGSAATGSSGIPINGIKVGLSEGLHYCTLFGAINSSGTATWRGGTAPSGTAGTAPTTLTLGLGR